MARLPIAAVLPLALVAPQMVSMKVGNNKFERPELSPTQSPPHLQSSPMSEFFFSKPIASLC